MFTTRYHSHPNQQTGEWYEDWQNRPQLNIGKKLYGKVRKDRKGAWKLLPEGIEERGKYQGAHIRKMNSHNAWPWKPEGLSSMSLYNWWILQPGALTTNSASGKLAGQVITGSLPLKCMSRCNTEATLFTMGGKDIYTDLGACWGNSLGTKDLAVTIFFPCPPA